MSAIAALGTLVLICFIILEHNQDRHARDARLAAIRAEEAAKKAAAEAAKREQEASERERKLAAELDEMNARATEMERAAEKRETQGLAAIPAKEATKKAANRAGQPLPVAGMESLILASSQDPLAIAANSTCVCWLNRDGSVMRASSQGGPPEVLASGQPGNTHGGIAVDSTNVYWTDADGTVRKAPLVGGKASVLAVGLFGPCGIAVDATSVYWTNYGSGTVMKVSIDGGPPQTLASDRVAPWAIAVDATSVYWTDLGAKESGFTDGTVNKVPIGGPGPGRGRTVKTLASGQGHPWALAIDSTSVYWANAGPAFENAAVKKVLLNGERVVTLALAATNSVAVDTTSVYWTRGSGNLMRLPIEGGSPAILGAGKEKGAGVVAVISGTIYWTQDGLVLKLTKDESRPQASLPSAGVA